MRRIKDQDQSLFNLGLALEIGGLLNAAEQYRAKAASIELAGMRSGRMDEMAKAFVISFREDADVCDFHAKSLYRFLADTAC